jgi:hypothetical protein
MQLEKVEALDAQSTQGLLDVRAQVPLGVATPHERIVLIRAGPHRRTGLRCDIDLVAVPATK